MATDIGGYLYVADTGNNRIVRLSPPVINRPHPKSSVPDFRVLRTWGTGGTRLGQLLAPDGVAVDGRGNIFVADTGNNRVQEYSPKGRLLAAWGKEGTKPGEFHDPTGIAVDTHGHVFVADTGNNRIQEFVISSVQP